MKERLFRIVRKYCFMQDHTDVTQVCTGINDPDVAKTIADALNKEYGDYQDWYEVEEIARPENPCMRCGAEAGPYWCSSCGAT